MKTPRPAVGGPTAGGSVWGVVYARAGADGPEAPEDRGAASRGGHGDPARCRLQGSGRADGVPLLRFPSLSF